MKTRVNLVILLSVLTILLLPAFGFADTAPTAAEVQKHLDFVWTLVAAFLVFFMQAGFAMVETGFTRAKNASNIIMKNLMDFAVGSLGYWAIGFGLMFGVAWKGIIGTSGFFFGGIGGDQWTLAFWMFQVVFAATAATIVSGAMAERTKFIGYLIYSVFISALIYPVFGSWAWGSLFQGSGWLEHLGFIDFAGSTVVHSVGGWAALAGAMVLGPRIGKYTKDGKVNPIPGHNLPLAALGVFILWFGWFGFNPGSTTAAIPDIAGIAVNTNLAAAAGAVMSMIASWVLFKKPDVGISLNGALAGLVAITAGCANVSPAGAVAIGGIAGVVVLFSVLFFDKIRIDDPVGAISVHGVCGAWGTLAAAIFDITGQAHIGVQLIGIAAAFVWTFTIAFILFKIIDKTIGLRVSKEEEEMGLDTSEHAATAYPDFSVSSF
ncbi:MAG: ammonium transporter [Deltaproteobacteria bacterium]|nr:ammonium transporter [Deltaproteobacteria bacterium]